MGRAQYSIGVSLEESFLPVLHLVTLEYTFSAGCLLTDFGHFHGTERLKCLGHANIVFHLTLRPATADRAMNRKIEGIPETIPRTDGAQQESLAENFDGLNTDPHLH